MFYNPFGTFSTCCVDTVHCTYTYYYTAEQSQLLYTLLYNWTNTLLYRWTKHIIIQINIQIIVCCCVKCKVCGSSLKMYTIAEWLDPTAVCSQVPQPQLPQLLASVQCGNRWEFGISGSRRWCSILCRQDKQEGEYNRRGARQAGGRRQGE